MSGLPLFVLSVWDPPPPIVDFLHSAQLCKTRRLPFCFRNYSLISNFDRKLFQSLSINDPSLPVYLFPSLPHSFLSLASLEVYSSVENKMEVALSCKANQDTKNYNGRRRISNRENKGRKAWMKVMILNKVNSLTSTFPITQCFDRKINQTDFKITQM